MEFIHLKSYTNYIDAHIAKGVLEENGIDCWLKDENTTTINPVLGNIVGGIKLMVVKDAAQRAWEILQELKKEQQQKIVCPKCNSHNLEFVSTPRKASNWLTALVTFFTGDFAIAPDKVYHCFDCGHEFSQKEDEAVG